MRRAIDVDDQQIIQAVNEVFIESFELEPDQLRPDAHIFTDLGLDSLDIVDLIAAFQKKFNVTLRDDPRIREVRILQDIYDYLMTLHREQVL